MKPRYMFWLFWFDIRWDLQKGVQFSVDIHNPVKNIDESASSKKKIDGFNSPNKYRQQLLLLLLSRVLIKK